MVADRGISGIGVPGPVPDVGDPVDYGRVEVMP